MERIIGLCVVKFIKENKEKVTRFIYIALGAVGGSFLRDSAVRLGAFLGISALWSIAIVNVCASFLAGAFWVFGEIGGVSSELRLLISVGFLGSFSTFSTFSLDLWQLGTGKQYGMALLYGFSSVLLSCCAVFIGVFVMKNLFK